MWLEKTRTHGESYLRKTQIALALACPAPWCREALRKLQEDGLVRARRGVGSFVRRRGLRKKLIELCGEREEYTVIPGLNAPGWRAYYGSKMPPPAMAAHAPAPREYCRIETRIRHGRWAGVELQARNLPLTPDTNSHGRNRGGFRAMRSFSRCSTLRRAKLD